MVLPDSKLVQGRVVDGPREFGIGPLGWHLGRLAPRTGAESDAGSRRLDRRNGDPGDGIDSRSNFSLQGISASHSRWSSRLDGPNDP